MLDELEGPEFPDELSYLWDWVKELHGQSGVGLSGWLPLTHTTIRDWRENMSITLAPHEVSALLLLDRALLYPEVGESENG